MRRDCGKPAALAALLVLTACLLTGCFGVGGGTKTSKKLTNYYGEGRVTGAAFFTNGGVYEELPAEQLDALVKKLEEMSLTHHTFHTDYFWGGQYGIELIMEGGVYLTYDGTRLALRDRTAKGDPDPGEELKDDFLEVTNMDFWKEMEAFFEGAKTISGR